MPVCRPCMLNLPLCRRSGFELLENRAMLSNAPMPVRSVRAFFSYNPEDVYAGIIRTLKYHGRPDIGRAMGRLFAQRLMAMPRGEGCEIHLSDIDVLLPIPMHPLKKLRRGFNQAQEIARGMAEACGAVVGDNLVAVKRHSTQTRLSFSERSSNIRGCFALRHGSELAGLNVAIVDDIITTGASMTEALTALAYGAPDAASVALYALAATARKS